MSLVPTREYTDVAAMLAHYASLRRKFNRPEPQEPLRPVVVEEPEPSPVEDDRPRDYKPWKPQELDRLREMAAEARPIAEMAQVFRRSEAGVEHKLRRMGVSFEPWRLKTSLKFEELLQRPAARDWMSLATPPKPTIHNDVLALVQVAFGVSVIDLASDRRTSHVALARQVASWLMRKHSTMSLPVIGKFLGGRDHTTIMHGCRVVEKKMAADDAFRAFVEKLSASVRARQTA